MREGEQDRGHQGGEGGEEHGPAAASEFARKQAGEDDGRGSGEGGQESKRPEGCADGVGEEPGDPSDERGLVDVSPGGMFAACEVVELVAEVAVVGAGEEVKDDPDGSDGENDRSEMPGAGGLALDDRRWSLGLPYGLYNRLSG